MRKFAWGEVEKIHKFKDYEIVEYFPYKFKNNALVKEELETKTSFYVDFCSEIFPTHDVAVIGILCKEYQGLNHHLTYPIARMLEMIKEEFK